MPLVGLTTFLMSGVELFKFWFNRSSNYRAIAINQAEQQIGVNVGQLGLVRGSGGHRSAVDDHARRQSRARLRGEAASQDHRALPGRRIRGRDLLDGELDLIHRRPAPGPPGSPRRRARP